MCQFHRGEEFEELEKIKDFQPSKEHIEHLDYVLETASILKTQFAKEVTKKISKLNRMKREIIQVV